MSRDTRHDTKVPRRCSESSDSGLSKNQVFGKAPSIVRFAKGTMRARRSAGDEITTQRKMSNNVLSQDYYYTRVECRARDKFMHHIHVHKAYV